MSETTSETTRCDSRYAELIDQLFVDEELPSSSMAKLKEHVAGCDGCRQRYNRVVMATRLLHGGPEAIDEPSPLELARVRAAVLERTRLQPDPAPARFAWLRWITGLAAVGAALAITLPLALRESGKPPAGPSSTNKPAGVNAPANPAFQARGAAPKRGKLVGLRAFCVKSKRAADPNSARVAELGDGETARCGVDDVLKLAYTNRSKLGHLFVVGVDARFKAQWYVPTPRTGKSISVDSGAVDEPLGRSVRLRVNHSAGALRIYALFSKEPLTVSAVSAAIAKAKASGAALSSLSLLPIDDTEQRSLLVTLTKPGAAK